MGLLTGEPRKATVVALADVGDVACREGDVQGDPREAARDRRGDRGARRRARRGARGRPRGPVGGGEATAGRAVPAAHAREDPRVLRDRLGKLRPCRRSFPRSSRTGRSGCPSRSCHTLHVEESGNPDGRARRLLPRRAGSRPLADAPALLRPEVLARRPLRPARLRQVDAARRAQGEHDVGPRRGRRADPDASRDREVARLRRLVGLDAGPRVRRDAPRARDRAHPARDLPRPEARDRLDVRGRPEAHRAGRLGRVRRRPSRRASAARSCAPTTGKLTSDDAGERREAALAWNRFENHASKLVPVDEPVAEEDVPKEIALARIEAHYFLNGSFLKSDDQLLHDAERLRRIPGVIVQGKYDLVCPLQSAWDLHLAWPEAQYVVVPDAGHAADEPGIVVGARRGDGRLQEEGLTWRPSSRRTRRRPRATIPRGSSTPASSTSRDSSGRTRRGPMHLRGRSRIRRSVRSATSRRCSTAAGSDLAHVLQTTVYVSDAAFWGRVNEVYARVMGDARPARAIVPVNEFRGGWQVEIAAIAAVRSSG